MNFNLHFNNIIRDLPIYIRNVFSYNMIFFTRIITSNPHNSILKRNILESRKTPATKKDIFFNGNNTLRQNPIFFFRKSPSASAVIDIRPKARNFFNNRPCTRKWKSGNFSISNVKRSNNTLRANKISPR